MKVIKLLGLLLLFTSCAYTTTMYYGVGQISEPTIKYEDGWYQVYYFVQVGRDANYYNVHYYNEGELIASNRTYIDKTHDYSVVYKEYLEVNEPTTLNVVVTSYIGNQYLRSNTKEFEIIIR